MIGQNGGQFLLQLNSGAENMLGALAKAAAAKAEGESDGEAGTEGGADAAKIFAAILATPPDQGVALDVAPPLGGGLSAAAPPEAAAVSPGPKQAGLSGFLAAAGDAPAKMQAKGVGSAPAAAPGPAPQTGPAEAAPVITAPVVAAPAVAAAAARKHASDSPKPVARVAEAPEPASMAAVVATPDSRAAKPGLAQWPADAAAPGAEDMDYAAAPDLAFKGAPRVSPATGAGAATVVVESRPQVESPPPAPAQAAPVAEPPPAPARLGPQAPTGDMSRPPPVAAAAAPAATAALAPQKRSDGRLLIVPDDPAVDGDLGRHGRDGAGLSPSRLGMTAPAQAALDNGGRALAAARSAAAQIGGAVARMSGDRVELRLDPPELGKVRLSFTFGHDGVTAVLAADRAETVDLLRRHEIALQEELTSAGFGEVDLSFGDGPFNADPQAGAEQAFGEAQEQQAADSVGRKRPTVATGRLDMRI